MAVLRGKREIANSEFENTFTSLYRLSETHTIAVPKRRKKWLCTPINSTMNRVYRDIMSMSDFYSPMKRLEKPLNVKIPTQKWQYEERRKHISNAIACLKEMNRGLIPYFNLMQYSERIMSEWSDMLVQELKMLIALQASDKRRFGSLK